MLNLFKIDDAFTLRGSQIERIRQVLDVARHQIRLGQHEDHDYRLENALIEAEDAIANARALIADAVDAAEAEREASGEADRERQRWLPFYHAA